MASWGRLVGCLPRASSTQARQSTGDTMKPITAVRLSTPLMGCGSTSRNSSSMMPFSRAQADGRETRAFSQWNVPRGLIGSKPRYKKLQQSCTSAGTAIRNAIADGAGYALSTATTLSYCTWPGIEQRRRSSLPTLQTRRPSKRFAQGQGGDN